MREEGECFGRDGRRVEKRNEEKKEGSMWWVPYSYGAVTKINDLTAFAIQLPRISFFQFLISFRLIFGSSFFRFLSASEPSSAGNTFG